MKILVVGDKNLVSSVSVTLNDVGMSLTINTVDRWLSFASVGGWCSGLLAKDIEVIGNSQISCFDVQNAEGDQSGSVVLVPENEVEKELLNGVIYEHQNKDQISILFVKTKLLLNETVIAKSWFTDNKVRQGIKKEKSFLSMVVGLLPKFRSKAI